MSFVEMQEKEIARNASKSDRGRGGRGRGRGRGARGQARGGARGRGGSLSMTSQNRVPFDYRAAQRNATDPPAEGEQEWELEVNLTMEDDEEEEDEDEDEDEEDEDEDFVIEAHKSMERTVAARRRMEGLYLNEHQQVIEKKEYNVLAMLKHANPLRRPILFVKASGVYDKGDKATPELEPMPKEAAKPATKEATKPAFKETPKPTPKETFKTAPKPTKADAVPPTTRDEASRSASDPPSVTPVRSPKRLKHAQHNDWADDFLSLRLADQILESDAPRKPVSEQDAILADWLENAMLGDMSSMDVPDIPGITTDPFGPATTLEDIAIDAHEREQDAWESGSESDADSDEFDMDEWHATMLQRVGASPESESDDEDMALDNLGSDAFLSDQGRVPPTCTYSALTQPLVCRPSSRTACGPTNCKRNGRRTARAKPRRRSSARRRGRRPPSIPSPIRMDMQTRRERAKSSASRRRASVVPRSRRWPRTRMRLRLLRRPTRLRRSTSGSRGSSTILGVPRSHCLLCASAIVRWCTIWPMRTRSSPRVVGRVSHGAPSCTRRRAQEKVWTTSAFHVSFVRHSARWMTTRLITVAWAAPDAYALT